MAIIKKYTKKDGSTAYMFNAYLGIDPLTGKPKRTTRRGFKKPKDAKLALAQLQLEVESQGFTRQDYSTFKDVYELWFAQYKNTVKQSSYERIECYFENQILPKFGHLKLDKIPPAYCQDTINGWLAEYKSFKKLKMYTSKIFEFGVDQHLIHSNPMDRVVVPRQRKIVKVKDEQNFLDKNQLTSFLTLLKEHESAQSYLMFHMLAYTGVRKGELLALCWNDIDFDNELLTVDKTVSYVSYGATITTTKTTSSDRVITIDSITLSYLKKWRLEQKKEFLSRGIRTHLPNRQLIFSDWKNDILREDVPRRILRRKPLEEFNITPHGFRHTHASLLFESGASMKEVQERLGHSDIKTTLNIYTHVTKEAEKNTARNFMKYMNS